MDPSLRPRNATTLSKNLRLVINMTPKSPSTTGKTLTKFHLFPKLPLELRCKVFKRALPNPDGRLLFLQMAIKAADGELGLDFTFSSPELFDQQPGLNTDLSLLSACVESREVYIEHNKNILPAAASNIIRYDAKNTVVYIENLDDINQLKNDVWMGIRPGWRKEKWINEVKALSSSPFAFKNVRMERRAIRPDKLHCRCYQKQIRPPMLRYPFV